MSDENSIPEWRKLQLMNATFTKTEQQPLFFTKSMSGNSKGGPSQGSDDVQNQPRKPFDPSVGMDMKFENSQSDKNAAQHMSVNDSRYRDQRDVSRTRGSISEGQDTKKTSKRSESTSLLGHKEDSDNAATGEKPPSVHRPWSNTEKTELQRIIKSVGKTAWNREPGWLDVTDRFNRSMRSMSGSEKFVPRTLQAVAVKAKREGYV